MLAEGYSGIRLFSINENTWFKSLENDFDADKDDILDFILSKDIFLNFMKKKRSGRKKTKL